MAKTGRRGWRVSRGMRAWEDGRHECGGGVFAAAVHRFLFEDLRAAAGCAGTGKPCPGQSEAGISFGKLCGRRGEYGSPAGASRSGCCRSGRSTARARAGTRCSPVIAAPPSDRSERGGGEAVSRAGGQRLALQQNLSRSLHGESAAGSRVPDPGGLAVVASPPNRGTPWPADRASTRSGSSAGPTRADRVCAAVVRTAGVRAVGIRPGRPTFQWPFVQSCSRAECSRSGRLSSNPVTLLAVEWILLGLLPSLPFQLAGTSPDGGLHGQAHPLDQSSRSRCLQSKPVALLVALDSLLLPVVSATQRPLRCFKVGGRGGSRRFLSNQPRQFRRQRGLELLLLVRHGVQKAQPPGM